MKIHVHACSESDQIHMLVPPSHCCMVVDMLNHAGFDAAIIYPSVTEAIEETKKEALKPDRKVDWP